MIIQWFPLTDSRKGRDSKFCTDFANRQSVFTHMQNNGLFKGSRIGEMPGCQSGFAMKLSGSSPLTNGTVIDTKTLCCRLLPFQPGKIVLYNLKLKTERILAHKKLHLTSLDVQLFGRSSTKSFLFQPSLFCLNHMSQRI